MSCHKNRPPLTNTQIKVIALTVIKYFTHTTNLRVDHVNTAPVSTHHTASNVATTRMTTQEQPTHKHA